MHIQNRIVILCFRILLVISAALGIIYSIGIPYGNCALWKFVLYTLLSNLLCFIFFIIAAIYTALKLKNDGIKGDATLWPRLKCGITIIITATFLVYCFVLAPQITAPAYTPYTPANLLLHYITPIAVIADWFLFDRKTLYKRYDPFLWLTGPLLYMLFIFIRAMAWNKTNYTGKKYPYFFMNIDILEWQHFVLYLLGFIIFFVVLGYVFLLIAKLSAKKPAG